MPYIRTQVHPICPKVRFLPAADEALHDVQGTIKSGQVERSNPLGSVNVYIHLPSLDLAYQCTKGLLLSIIRHQSSSLKDMALGLLTMSNSQQQEIYIQMI